MVQITLPQRCDRSTVLALLPEFRAAAGAEPIAVDASAVTQAGQALLQLLVSARRTEAGAQIVPSPALIDAAELTGLTALLFDGEAA